MKINNFDIFVLSAVVVGWGQNDTFPSVNLNQNSDFLTATVW